MPGKLFGRCYRGLMDVLVIDDDVELCTLLRRVFEREGLRADFCHNGTQGLRRALDGDCKIIVLDVMLPEIDGLEVLRRLRKQSETPVLMLTARSEDVDRIVGLELGADDYLAKPFHPRELIARLRAILRRSSKVEEPHRVLQAAGVRLDPAARSVSSHGQPVGLTTTEFDVLQALMESAGRVLSRDALIEQIDGRQADPFDRSIDVHVSHLRKKLGKAQQQIKTVRGVGYQFALESEDESHPAAQI